MTTHIELDADTTTLAELCEALEHARIAEKKCYLRSRAQDIPAIRARIQSLTSQFEAMLDRDPDDTARTDNTFDPADLGHGFHVSRDKRGSRI